MDKYIQRRWSGPLAPTAVIGSETEIDFHPDQMLCLQFNKITGGIYGYSTFRETLFALKGYLVMLQYLPTIVGKRGDKTIVWNFGGTYFDETHQQVSSIPATDDILRQKTTIENRQQGEDVWVNFLVKGEELYKAGGTSDSVANYLQAYKERVLLGMGIPLTVATLGGGQEIKWGSLNFELMEDETRENQEKLEQLHMDYVIPRILLNLRPGRQLGDGPEVDVQSQPPRK
ncbi:MAG TPA: hypothetical protein VFE98_03010 [Candidatus Bathyarchaeia archaeon]|nr:hypothetical protein [Candidatus Bathyarchaeia archaeon]